jgi:hypothetical protein
MTTPTPARSADPPTTSEIADRNHEWQATTDEALARIDNAVTIISAHVETFATALREDTSPGSSPPPSPSWNSSPNASQPLATGDDEHPF